MKTISRRLMRMWRSRMHKKTAFAPRSTRRSNPTSLRRATFASTLQRSPQPSSTNTCNCCKSAICGSWRRLGRSVEETQAAFDLIRTLDPRPGQRYNRSEARLIEPDVAFVKRDSEYVVVMNEDDYPRSASTRAIAACSIRMAPKKTSRNMSKSVPLGVATDPQRRAAQEYDLRTCESIVRRQGEFLERGVEYMKPMMIKEVAEEIGVHPSTVSRAVSNKYVHTAQGVFELRFFFSEGVKGPTVQAPR